MAALDDENNVTGMLETVRHELWSASFGPSGDRVTMTESDSCEEPFCRDLF
jgi:hypothetical protein